MTQRGHVLIKDPFNIEGLKDEYLIKIVEEILINKKSNITINVNLFKENLRNIDPFQRPLFAMFIGNAIANGQHIRDWNLYNLLDYQLDYELENVTSTFPNIVTLIPFINIKIY